ncbi:MAG: hypothetical protein LBB74_02195 [Chitinispirillales bacterium]|jgi:hypothetical protein|nr:hypothetical protein [Chitinispirillales bacterium]
MMRTEKKERFVYLLTAVFCAVCTAYAQDAGKSAAAPSAPDAKAAPAKAGVAAAPAAQDRPVIKNLEIRSGARGMILIINSSGPIPPLGGKSTDFEKATAKYREFTVNIASVGSALGAVVTFNPPPELPIKDITLKNVASGLTVTIKMRVLVNGPIDVKNSDNQVRILLTRDALPEMVWSSEKGVVSAPPPPPVAGGSPPAPAKGVAAAAPQKQAPVAPNVASKTETPAALPQVHNTSQSGEVTKKTPEGELVRYKVFGRDPFIPLVRDTATTALPSVENLKLVGVLEDARERIALVEDFKNGNRAFALRVNDPVAQGKVLRVHRDKVVFLIRDFEVSHSYTLGLSNTDK